MWACGHCGCKAIAADLASCPQCFKPKEEDMPKITSGGATNAWEPQPDVPAEVPAEVPAPPPVSAPKADHAAYAAAVLDVPAEEAEAMTKPDLVDLTRSAPAAPPQSAPQPPPAPPAGDSLSVPPKPAESPSAPPGDVAMLRLVLALLRIQLAVTGWDLLVDAAAAGAVQGVLRHAAARRLPQ